MKIILKLRAADKAAHTLFCEAENAAGRAYKAVNQAYAEDVDADVYADVYAAAYAEYANARGAALKAYIACVQTANRVADFTRMVALAKKAKQ
jgi:hypothetical protein